MRIIPWQLRGYTPGPVGKAAVVVAAALYFTSLYFSARAGGDLAQGAFLNLLVPFIFVAPAWLVGYFVYFIPRVTQRTADIVFGCVLLGECLFLAVVGHTG